MGMSDMAELSITSDNQFERIKSIMASLPQLPAFKTDHFFAGGMYCRRIEIPAGSIILSKVHKTEHHFIGCAGELVVAGQGETYTLSPGDVVVSKVGTRRVVFAKTDVVCMTVHRTDMTSTDGLEQELMQFDEDALYDVNNKPKPGVLVCDSVSELR